MCQLNQVEFWCELLSLQDTDWNVGVDINPEMLDHARGQPKGKNKRKGASDGEVGNVKDTENDTQLEDWGKTMNREQLWFHSKLQWSEARQVIVPFSYYMVLIMRTLPHSLLIHAYRQSLDQGSATPSMCAKCGIRWVSNPFLLLDCFWKHKNILKGKYDTGST